MPAVVYCQGMKADLLLQWKICPQTDYTSSMFVSEYTKDLAERLSLDSFPFDISLNGVQIGAPDREFRKAAFAVDASFDTINSAIENGADVLVVHHGLFWGQPLAITGAHYRRVRRAIEGGLTLFAAHLPLDVHPLYGNNVQMALRLGMTEFDPFGDYKGIKVGFKGSLPFPMTIPEIARLLGFSSDTGMQVLKFGPDMISTVGIISGAGGDDADQAIRDGLDLLITGTVPHEVFHTVKENGLNLLAGGHYRSEVFGVQALMRFTQNETGVESFFIDAETGL